MLKRNIGKNKNGGRDFIVGDLHGCLGRLHQFMRFINFDITKDRLLSVGDLVDRGRQSLECLALIYEPWFFAVRGNHEQLMYEYFTDGPSGMWWEPNGGGWGVNYKNDNVDDVAMVVRDMVKKANELPLMLTAEKQDGTCFHVIHAELSGAEPFGDEDLENEDYFKYIALRQSGDGESIIWGRHIFMALYGTRLDQDVLDRFNKRAEQMQMGSFFNSNLSHIYSGHTIVRNPVRFMGQTNLDTGAYKSIPEFDRNGKQTYEPIEWTGLTFTEPATDKFWKVNEAGVTEVQPVILGY